MDLAKPVPEDLGFRTGCALWIVDPNDPHILLPYGAEGELVVEGPNVGRGYLSMPERTARAWINAPKWARNEHHDYRRRRFYLSGDICKLVDSGSVHFVRRKDSQVKLRGQRIALEEVEAKLEESLPGFVLAADIVHYETEQTDRTLLLGFAAEAYGDSGKAMIVPRAGVGSLFDLTLSKLKKILPPYMVPSAVVPLSVLPLNRSGKLDRRQLKTLATAASTAQIFGASAAHTSAEHTLTDLQAQLRSLWHRILGIHIQNIGVYDNFFKLGADSVTAISLVALAKREGLLITVADILKFPTLAELASVAVVAREEESSKVSVPKCFSLLHDKEQILSDIYETYYLRCGMIEDVLPCTSMQEGLMLLSTRSPGAYIGQEVFELPEDIDISLLKKAWTAVCSVIPIWRTRIVASYKGKTFQVVLRETVQWQEFFSLAEMRQEQSRQRMSLGDRLVNFALIFDKQRRASHFVMTAHHSLYDAWTLSLTFEQFRRTYHGQASRPLLPMSVFVDQTASQRSESLEFWTKYLHNLQSTPFPRSNAVQTGPSHSRCYEARLQVNMPTESKWTAFTVIKAAWAILSNHFTSCEDIIFGTTVSGRQSSVPGIDSICGPTIATVPCRVRVEPQLALRELFDTIQKDAADMIVHEQVGLQTIQRISDSIRHGCDFGCLILMQSRNSDDERATDILGPRRFAEDAARTNSYALTLDLMPTAEGFHITAAYDTRSLSWDRVEAIVRHMEHLLQRITSADETTRLDKIPTVRDEDLRLMQHRRGNPRSREKTAHELIEVQVYTQPDAVAISSWDGGDLTYGRLWQLSDCLSAALRRHGVGPDVLIPLVFEKSMWAVVAMLSVLKAGGGFVSIDPNGPKERACLICDEVNASVVLASAMHKDLLLDEVQTCIAVDSNIFEREVFKKGTAAAESETTPPSSIMYAVFTSGSTGIPKGCLIEHRSFTAAALAVAPVHGMSTETRALQFANYCFDVAIEDIFTTLIMGGCICIPSQDELDNDLSSSTAKYKSNYIELTPTVVSLIDLDMAHTLKTVILSGESASKLHLPKETLSKIRFVNSYGLSETSITNFVSEDLQAYGTNNIGRPVGCEAWVVDASNPDRLVPVGAEGELLISGVVLSRGYLGQPEKTSESFVPPPEWARSVGSASSRFYKTGDLARFTSDGRAILIGRKDQQVKLNGLRIELLEVESHIQRYLPNYSNVVGVFDHEGRTNRSTLVGFLAKHHNTDVDSVLGSDEDETEIRCQLSAPKILRSKEKAAVSSGLRVQLSQSLPTYMVPSVLVHVDRIPLTPAGKADRRLLQTLVKTAMQQNISDARNSNERTEKALSATQLQIRDVWAQILGLCPDSITAKDHFFILGGDSVAAMAVVAALRKKGCRITVASIFQNPVLEACAHVVALAQRDKAEMEAKHIHESDHGLDDGSPQSKRISGGESQPLPLSNSADLKMGAELAPGVRPTLLANRTKETFPVPNAWPPIATIEAHVHASDNPATSQISRLLNIASDIVEDVFPCTPIQQGFMTLSSRDGSYKSNTALKLRCDTDIPRLKKSWEAVVSRMPIWRTRIVQLPDDHLAQAVLSRKIEWQERIVTNFSAFLQEAHIPDMGLNQDLSHFLLVKENTTGTLYLVIAHHHAIYDGLSLQDTLWRVETLYRGDSMDNIVPFKSFVDYIGTEDERLRNSSSFWASYFRGVNCSPFPPTHGPRAGDLVNKTIRKDLQFRWSEELRYTSFTMVKAAWSILSHEYTSSDDIIFGATLNGRNAPMDGIEDVAGPTITTVPLRIRINRDWSLEHLLEQVQVDAVAMMPHEQTGLHTIRRINEETNLGCHFSSLIVFQGAEDTDEEDQIMQRVPEVLESDNLFNSYALTLEVLTNPLGVQVIATYDSSVLSEVRLTRILAHLEHCLSRLNSASLSTKLWELIGINPYDLQQIESWNLESEESFGNSCIHDVFSTVAQKYGTHTAVRAWDGVLSYESLDDMSTKLSHQLVELNDEQNMVVLLCFDKSKWAVISMLAVLKAGCAFASIDPRSPISRLEKVRDLTGTKFGLCSRGHARIYQDLAIQSLVVEDADYGPVTSSKGSSYRVATASSLAYVIFTSGSSGTPKAVGIEHKAYLSNAHQLAQALGMHHGTRTLQFANSTFDTSIEEICTTLLMGGSVCIPSSAECSNNLSQAIRDYEVTLADLTPSVAALLEVDVGSSLETVILGGELATSTLDHCRRRGITVKNSYGLTEASITNTIASDISTIGPANIGRPVGCRIWVVDAKNHDILAPIGAEGEMLIEGTCLARGYINDDEKTDQAFIYNPSWAGHTTPRRFYKTGDVARYHDDGSIVYCHRKDNQVKLRGLRIELGEVETQLKAILPEYHIAVEVVSRIGELQTVKALAGYVACRTMPFHETTDITMDLSPKFRQKRDEAIRQLSSVLPAYMVPSVLIPLSHMPLNSSGKSDRKRLRLIVETMSDGLAKDISDHNAPKSTPQGTSEQTLQTLWAQILGVRPDGIGRNDNFFHLGGDSIRAMQLVASGRSMGVKLTVAMIFQHPVLLEMGKNAKVSEPHVTSNAAVMQRKTAIPGLELDLKANEALKPKLERRVELTDFQALCTNCLFDLTPGFLTYVIIRYDQRVDKRRVQKACQSAVNTTEVLRTVFVNDPQQPYGIVLETCRPSFESLRTSVDLCEFFAKLVALDQLVTPPDDVPPSKFWYVEGQARDALVIKLSHAQFDGLSLPMLFQSLQNNVDTDSRPMTFYTNAIKTLDLSAAENYWRRLLYGSAMTQIPGSRRSPRHEEGLVTVERFLTQFKPGIPDLTFATYLKAAWALVLAGVSETDDVVFGHLVSGRAVPLDDIERVNGPCINLIPIRLNALRTHRNLLNQVQEQQIASMSHETLGFRSIFRKCTNWQPDAKQIPRFSSIVQHQNLLDECETIDLHGASCEISYEASPTNITDLWVITEPRAGGLHVSMSYFKPGVDCDVATRLFEQLCLNLEDLQRLQ